MIWLVLALLLLILQIAVVLVREHRRPVKAVAWMFLVFAMPFVGFVLYCFVAQEYKRRWKMRMETETAGEGDAGRQRGSGNAAERLFRVMEGLPGADLSKRNRVRVLSSADECYRLMLEDIAAAQHHVHMLYYIWNNDESGQQFKQALMRKASEGVQVRVVIDGIGSRKTPKRLWGELRNAGIAVHRFLPPGISFLDRRLNYRNHRKITVIDGTIGYVGGINIGDEYRGRNPKLGYWRDTSVRFEGDAAHGLQRTFVKDWFAVSGERLADAAALYPSHPIEAGDAVQIVEGGPDEHRHTILEMFFAALCAAGERIYITTPYFIPDPSIRMALRTAALSGVDVRLLIPGVADSRLPLWATLSHVEELLRFGVRVYRYQKGFIHAKTIVVDRFFATTGTANMDMRSFFSNFEINAVFSDERIVEQFAEDLFRDLEDSTELRYADFRNRGRAQRMREAVGRMLSPLL